MAAFCAGDARQTTTPEQRAASLARRPSARVPSTRLSVGPSITISAAPTPSYGHSIPHVCVWRPAVRVPSMWLSVACLLPAPSRRRCPADCFSSARRLRKCTTTCSKS